MALYEGVLELIDEVGAENVFYTLEYIRNNQGINKVLIITNDYHVSRVKIISNSLKGENEPYQFYFVGMESNYSKMRNIRILFKEVYKVIRTFFFLLLWET